MTEYQIAFDVDGFEPRFTSHLRLGIVESHLTWNKLSLHSDEILPVPVTCRETTATQWAHFTQLRAAFWRFLGAE